MSSFNQLLLTACTSSVPPVFINEMPDAPPTRAIRLIDWAAAGPQFHYRRRHPDGTVIDEAPHTWGNMLYLQLMLAVGIDDLAPHFAKELAAFAPYLIGPPHSAEREDWERVKPLPELYQRRFQALRRRAWLWVDRDPALLPMLVARYESKSRLAVWAPGKTRVSGSSLVTPVDLAQLQRLPLDPRRTSSVTKPLDTVVTDAREEVKAIDRMERFGVATEFPLSAKLYKNYVFVKLVSYVRTVWELQEVTPALHFGPSISAGQPISDATLAVGVVAARRWFSEQFLPVGIRAYTHVLDTLGMQDSDDTAVFYRSRAKNAGVGSREHATHKPKVYTVNPPPDLAEGHGLRPVRVRVSRGSVYVHPEDMGTTADAVGERYARLGPDREGRAAAFKKNLSRVGTTRYVKASVFSDTIEEPLLRAWFEPTFVKDPKAWVKEWVKADAGRRRAEGETTRLKIPFTVDEDREIAEVTKPYTSKETWDALSKKYPHHSPRRISERGKLLLALLKHEVRVGTEVVTPDLVMEKLGKAKHTKFARAL